MGLYIRHSKPLLSHSAYKWILGALPFKDKTWLSTYMKAVIRVEKYVCEDFKEIQ